MIIGMDSPVGQSLGRKVFKGQYVGLELEYEKVTSPPAGLGKEWYTDIDHSLRAGGLEFISIPLKRAAMRNAITRMVESAKAVGATVTARCGLHVHVNVTDSSWADLFKFVTYYTLLEPLMFACFAPGRELSHFCVPTWTNTSLCEHMYLDGQKLRSGIHIPDIKGTNWTKASVYMNASIGGGRARMKMLNTPKYAALNLSSLKKFGTLEFRQAPSSLSPLFIERWARLLLEIQTISKSYQDSTDIVMAYDRHGILNLCAAVGFIPKQQADPMDQEDAADAATIMAGHIPVDWQSLKWEIK